MKILLVSSTAKESGSAQRAAYIAKYLRREGNEVFFINPIRTFPFPLDYAISLPLYSMKSILKDCDAAMAIKPSPNGCVPILLKKLSHSKAVVDIDDLDYGQRKGFVSSVIRIGESPFPKRCDLVTYHNDYLYQHILRNYEIPSEMMYKLDQGVDLDIFNPLRKDLREFNSLNEEEYLVVYTGYLNTACNLESILEGIKLAVIQNPNIKLLIVGGGPLLRYYKNLVVRRGLQKSVSFTGYIENIIDIPKYISIANTCIVYYKDIKVNYYRASMKLREYLAMGKKVVCNDVGDLGLFEKYTYQTSSNIEEFANKIVELVEQEPDKRVRLGQRYVENNYSWDMIGKRFNEKLEEIVDGH